LIASQPASGGPSRSCIAPGRALSPSRQERRPTPTRVSHWSSYAGSSEVVPLVRMAFPPRHRYDAVDPVPCPAAPGHPGLSVVRLIGLRTARQRSRPPRPPTFPRPGTATDCDAAMLAVKVALSAVKVLLGPLVLSSLVRVERPAPERRIRVMPALRTARRDCLSFCVPVVPGRTAARSARQRPQCLPDPRTRPSSCAVTPPGPHRAPAWRATTARADLGAAPTSSPTPLPARSPGLQPVQRTGRLSDLRGRRLFD